MLISKFLNVIINDNCNEKIIIDNILDILDININILDIKNR